jgi:galactokinase
VSLLGSHSDCAGYSCVAAALEQDLLMAFSVVEPGQDGAEEIEVHNVDEKFEEGGEKISNDPEQKFFDGNKWINYFLSGYKALMLHNENFTKLLSGPPKGLKIFIDSNVPIAAGLSSSSALTVCTSILAA